MLTGFQTEVVAFIDNGGIVCPACAVADHGPLVVSKAERGYLDGDLSPLCRYSLDEYNGERVYEAAEEAVRDTADRLGIDSRNVRAWASYSGRDIGPPARARSQYDRYHRLIDKVADRLGDSYGETCDDCYQVLS